jgi:hypothetical protein
MRFFFFAEIILSHCQAGASSLCLLVSLEINLIVIHLSRGSDNMMKNRKTKCVMCHSFYDPYIQKINY